MYTKKLKRICMVKGCKNTDTYAVSTIPGYGDTVIICEKCLREALAAIEHYDEPKPTPERPKPKLFYNHLTVTNPKTADTDDGEDASPDGIPPDSEVIPDGYVPDTDSQENNSTTDTAEPIEDGVAPDSDGAANADNSVQENSENPVPDKQFVCDKCGKVCASQSGLASHKKACDDK